MLTGYAPIAYFAFNRPAHAARSLAALAANPEAADTDLHIFIDGPRNADEAALVAEVERIAKSTQGFRNIGIVASPTNQGLYSAVTTGVDRVVAQSGRVIVVEDDIVVSPHFLRYMNDGLERYAADERVGSIHAYSPPIPGLPDFFFLRGADCWGWATWADRWASFDPDARSVLARVATRLPEFARSHGWQSVVQLVRRAQRRNQSWAILWHASLFLADRFTLHPGASFVENIGNDGSGAHSAETDLHSTTLLAHYDGLPPGMPVTEDARTARALGAFLDDLAIGRHAGRIGRLALSLYARWLVRVQR